ncbi:MAG: flagellar motor protein MotB [Planctomycetota bacterium]
MGKKHKHEEHENHERWVISYADMVTLLFALFVVLYALGEVKLKKLKELKKSMAFAFHFEGHGKTFEDGLHERGDIGGDLLEAAILLNPQKGPMKEFLLRALPNEFEEITGRSIDIELADDSMRFTGPLSAFFAPTSQTLRDEMHPWVTDLVESAHQFAAQIRIHIKAPKIRLGTYPSGRPYFSTNLCLERLNHLLDLVALMSTVMREQVTIQFDYMPGPAKGWDDVAQIAFFFSNG